MLDFSSIEKVRTQNPLVHNITNIVVANDSANGLLAIGASPFMASGIEEMTEVPAIASVVVINIGTLGEEQVAAMLLAGKTANEKGTPLVLDPVGAGATSYRKETVEKLLAHLKFALIRGNGGEIAALAGADWQAKGVDAGNGEGDLVKIAEAVARKYQTIVAVSGEEDIITDGTTTYKVANGTPYFPKMTGAGCLLSCIAGAYLAADPQNPLMAITCAHVMYAVCGEIVAAELPCLAVGTFRQKLLDELSIIDATTVQAKARVEEVAGK